jgi:choline dehydrogenase
MPAGFFQLMRTGQVDWGYHSLPQPRLGGRRIHSPRGKVLGGSSSVNGMIYIRGDASDFDHWAQLGNRGWSYADCLPYFQKAENFAGPGSPARGRSGPLKTTRNGINHPLAKAFVTASQQAGLPYNDDFNSGGDQEGVGPTDCTLAEKRRYSSSVAYLHPAMNRPNLTVITRALASRVLLEKGRAVGVEYLQGRETKTLYADKEVILAGGAVNSPQLLQLSGIGDSDHLQTVGVRTVHELKGVGRNLQDHPAYGVKQLCTQPISYYPKTRMLNAAVALAQYALTNSGPAAGNGLETMAFVRTRPGLIAPDIQYFMMLLMYEDSGRKILPHHGYMMYFTLQRPESRGSLMITSSDPRVAPGIDLNYFERSIDLETMRDAVKIARDIFAQKGFDPYRGAEFDPGPEIRTDRQIEDHIRKKVDSNYHLSGTCRMGPDQDAVVDSQLRVHDVEGLRVVDASIMPTVVSGNTNAATIMIAEKGADMILGRHAA